MGLDIYVGPLTRLYSCTWENVIQQLEHQDGIPTSIRYPDGFNPPSAEEALDDVIRWRNAVNRHFADDLDKPLDWPEGAEEPYYTDKPDTDPYLCLLAAARYVDTGQTLPEELDVKGDIPILSEMKGEIKTRFPHLLLGVELWLPADFNLLFSANDAIGNQQMFGSTLRLLEELKTLNAECWGADPETLKSWSRGGPHQDGAFQHDARFGFAVLYAMAEKAVETGYPMALDY